MLVESADEIERATGHRLRVVRALVRDPAKERPFPAGDGVLVTDFETFRDDPEVQVVAEVMGGISPAGDYVRALLGAGKPVVSANKQLIARDGAELFAAASAAGVQLRFEASVCAAIPVVKVLRESLVVSNVHRVLGIVNGTTNFMLSSMERGGTYADALAEAQALGYAEADPTDDVSGADAAAKMAILATVAFGSRVRFEDVECRGIEELEPAHVTAAAQLGMVVRLVGIATLAGDAVDVRVQPAFVDRAHPLAAVDGAFNAVMLQGDAIREITLEGPGAGGLETASAVEAARRRALAQVGGCEPDRLVQGPRDGPRGVARARARRGRRRVRVHGQHGGVVRGVRGARRSTGCGVHAARRGRARQGRAGARDGRGRARDRRHVRGRACGGAPARRGAAVRQRQLDQPGPHRG